MMTRRFVIGLSAGIGIAISFLVAINLIPDMIKYTDSELVFENATNISNSTGNSISSEIVTSRNNVYIVWDDGTDTDAYDIFFRASYDFGSTFRDAINLSNTKEESIEPDMATSGRNIYVVWAEKELSENELSEYEVYFSRSTDNGKSFEPPVNLSNTTGFSSTPFVVASGSKVYVVWTEHTPENYGIYLRSSTDNGKSFEPPVSLRSNSSFLQFPRIVTSGDMVYIIWEEGTDDSEIFFSKSDNGSKFSYPVNISNNTGRSVGQNIIADSNSLYIVWYEEQDTANVFFRKSNDKGNNFEPKIMLSDSRGDALDPQLLLSGNNVYVIWLDTGEGNFGMLVRKSTNSGSSFDDHILMSNETGSSFNQRMIASSNYTYVVWDEHEPAELFIAKEMKEGSFEPFVSLRKMPYNCCIEYGQLSITWGHVYVIWHEFESLDSGEVKNDEIFFKSTPVSAVDKFLALILEYLTI